MRAPPQSSPSTPGSSRPDGRPPSPPWRRQPRRRLLFFLLKTRFHSLEKYPKHASIAWRSGAQSLSPQGDGRPRRLSFPQGRNERSKATRSGPKPPNMLPFNGNLFRRCRQSRPNRLLPTAIDGNRFNPSTFQLLNLSTLILSLVTWLSA